MLWKSRVESIAVGASVGAGAVCLLARAAMTNQSAAVLIPLEFSLASMLF